MTSFFGKIKNALSSTSNKIVSGITNIIVGRKLDENTIEELEELLITADMGVHTASAIIDKFRKQKFGNETTVEEIQCYLAKAIEDILNDSQKSFVLENDKLNIILVCGVNGNGKTTTIGKLASLYKSEGKKVMVAACDTFRAAAVEQLEVWTNRADVEIVRGIENSDPASVAYAAVEKAISQHADILLIDTAGRLHNQQNLMDELSKITRSIEKVAGFPPQHSLLVLDATTGQNALTQLEQFQVIAHVNGLVVTKLDGTAKAGVVVTLSQKFKIPVYFIGLGEAIEDLKIFDSADFAKALVGAGAIVQNMA
jgi:fused signal recognition particle receptor